MVIFLESEDPNIKCIAFESCADALVLPGSEDAFGAQINLIINSLETIDPYLSKRSLDLLYLLCSQSNVGRVIEPLLRLVDKVDPGLQEELVLKIAVLAESFAPNLEWYLDVIVTLLAKPGDFVGDDIWWRCCQVITGFGEKANREL